MTVRLFGHPLQVIIIASQGDGIEEDLNKLYERRMSDCPLVDSPEPHWIPVTERLPEENYLDDGYVEPSQYVLVYMSYHVCKVSRYWGHRKTKGTSDYIIPDWMDLEEHDGDNVLAWMPLSEPYRGVTEESKERKGIERTCRVEYHNVDGRIEEIPVCCSTCEHYVYFSGYEVLCRKYKGNQRFGYSITGDAYQKCLYKDWTWKGH